MFRAAAVAVLLKAVVLKMGRVELVWLRTGPTVMMGMVLEVVFIGFPRMGLNVGVLVALAVVLKGMLVMMGMVELEVVLAKMGAAVAVLFMLAVAVALELKLLVKVVCGTS